MQVPDTAVGRLSVCTTTDVPFKEMAGHCEALVMGKQQKMSIFLSTQQKQEICLRGLSQNRNDVKQSSNLRAEQFQQVCIY